jgi:hypothetical protein
MGPSRREAEIALPVKLRRACGVRGVRNAAARKLDSPPRGLLASAVSHGMFVSSRQRAWTRVTDAAALRFALSDEPTTGETT